MTSDATSPLHLARRFELHVRESGLLDASRDDVLLALSGGLDSIVLLDLLRRAHFTLMAAHYDHGMRPDSAADAAWVRAHCERLGIMLIDARATHTPRSEADARTQRYAFLADAAARAGATAIATAHHADDQAETVLFRLARGTGVRGLAGIPARRGNIVRPLLPFTRAEILAHAQTAGLDWREDATNAEPRYARNRIRHQVLPALEAIRPGATRHIAQVAMRAAESERAWREVVRDVVADVVTRREQWGYALARDRILAYHPHVRARVIRQLLGRLDSSPDRSATRFVLHFIESGQSGRAVRMPDGVQVAREFDRILLRRAGAATVPSDAPLMIRTPEAGTGMLVAGGRTYEARWSPVPDETVSGERASFDLSSLRFPLELRGWQAGDRIRLRGGTRKLKKLFQEKRVVVSRRASVPVLADAAGEVLWAAGLARSDRFLPGAETQVFEISVMDVTTS